MALVLFGCSQVLTSEMSVCFCRILKGLGNVIGHVPWGIWVTFVLSSTFRSQKERVRITWGREVNAFLHGRTSATLCRTSGDPKTTDEKWKIKKWKIKVKETKSSHVTSTLRKDNCPSNKHQSNSATTGRICKVPRTTFRLQTELERAHCQEKETNLT